MLHYNFSIRDNFRAFCFSSGLGGGGGGGQFVNMKRAGSRNNAQSVGTYDRFPEKNIFQKKSSTRLLNRCVPVRVRIEQQLGR